MQHRHEGLTFAIGKGHFFFAHGMKMVNTIGSHAKDFTETELA
jgi:hypothetical protein